MNYKKELNRLRKRRKQYRPVMAMLMKMHAQSDSSGFPVELIDRKELLVMLELLDIGYLDANALIVKKRFGDIAGLSYTGEYPFTESGDFFYQQSGSAVIRMITTIFRSIFSNADIRSQ
jgi:hypothetical protein